MTKTILSATFIGVLISFFSVFYSYCGSEFNGYDCRRVSDMIFSHGFPFGYYFTGGFAGIQEFNLLPFMADILVWSVIALLLILGINKLTTRLRS